MTFGPTKSERTVAGGPRGFNTTESGSVEGCSSSSSVVPSARMDSTGGVDRVAFSPTRMLSRKANVGAASPARRCHLRPAKLKSWQSGQSTQPSHPIEVSRVLTVLFALSCGCLIPFCRFMPPRHGPLTRSPLTPLIRFAVPPLSPPSPSAMRGALSFAHRNSAD